jgi:hypothetical protein
MKHFIRMIGVAILSAILALSIVFPIAASVTAPDSLTLMGTWAFRNNIETGDMTFVFYYNAYYADIDGYPTEVSTDTLLLRLMYGTTEIGSTAPYPYYSNGYQRGVAIIYFSAVQVTAIETSIGYTLWNLAITPKIVPNPLVAWDSTPAESSTTIVWDTAVAQSDAQESLGDRIISLALQLKAYWGINLVEASDGLNYALTVSSAAGSGVDYFLDVAPNMGALAPDIFPTQIEQPIFKTTDPVLTYLPDDLPVDSTPSANLFGMTKGTLNSLLSMIGILIFSFVIIAKSPNLSRFILLFDGVIVIFFTRIGAIIPVWATLTATVALLVIGYMIFYEKSTA